MNLKKSEVALALYEPDNIRRLEILRDLLAVDALTTKAALLEFSNAENDDLRSTAIWALSLLPTKHDPDVISTLISNLKTNNNASTRLCCVIGLAETKTPEVTKAYIQASTDSNERVATWACLSLSLEGHSRKEAIEALFQRLSASSWDVRLEACKGLIYRKAADQRVVDTLEKMAQESEAKEYNRQDAESKWSLEEYYSKHPDEQRIEMWGNLEEITEQARQIAARN